MKTDPVRPLVEVASIPEPVIDMSASIDTAYVIIEGTKQITRITQDFVEPLNGVGAAASRLDVDEWGRLWILPEAGGELLRLDGDNVVSFPDPPPSICRDLAVGDGHVWVTTDDQRIWSISVNPEGNPVGPWLEQTGAATRLDIDHDGRLWCINTNTGELFTRDTRTETELTKLDLGNSEYLDVGCNP